MNDDQTPRVHINTSPHPPRHPDWITFDVGSARLLQIHPIATDRKSHEECRVMGCHEMKELEQTHKLNREAAMFLGCDQATGPATIKLLIRRCRADQVRIGHAILTHRRDCPVCNGPSWIEF